MASITIKNLDDDVLQAIKRRADDAGMSTQAYLRRLVAREAAIPVLPSQLDQMIADRRQRTPMTMQEFDTVRRKAWRR